MGYTKNAIIKYLMIVFTIFVNNAVFADNGWKTEKVGDGKITVQYHISKRTDENGKKVPLIEYIVTTTDNVDFSKCIALMKDVSRHKEFTGDFKSEKVQEISENQSINYYYAKASWPLSDNDCVLKMVISEDSSMKTAQVTMTAEPTLYKTTEVNRITYQHTVYSFKDVGDGKTEVTISMKISPPYKVPGFLINAGFPGEPAKAVKNVIKAANAAN